MKLTGVVLTAFLASPITLAAMLRGDIHQRVLIDETVDKGTVVPHSETEGDKTYGYGFGGGGGQQQQQQQQQQQGGGGWGGGGQQQQQQQQGGGGWGGGDQQQQQQQQQGGRGWRLLAEEAEPDNANVGTKVGVPIEEGQDKEQQQQQQQMNGPFGTMQQQQGGWTGGGQQQQQQQQQAGGGGWGGGGGQQQQQQQQQQAGWGGWRGWRLLEGEEQDDTTVDVGRAAVVVAPAHASAEGEGDKQWGFVPPNYGIGAGLNSNIHSTENSDMPKFYFGRGT